VKPSSKYIELNILDLSVLLWHVFRAAQDPRIGYNDSEMPLNQLIRQTGNSARAVNISLLEKLLYPANMLDEQGQFWHYKNKSFTEFVDSLGIKYDRNYGWIK